MAENDRTMAMGWLPDFPDFRDYTVQNEDVRGALKKAGVAKPLKAPPPSADLRPWCSPIEDQSLAGVIMWVPGSAAFTLALLWLVFQALAGESTTSRAALGETPGRA